MGSTNGTKRVIKIEHEVEGKAEGLEVNLGGVRGSSGNEYDQKTLHIHMKLKLTKLYLKRKEEKVG